MAKVRSAPRPPAGRATRPHQTAGGGRRGRPRVVGRRRGGASPFALVATFLFRRETVGAALVLLAALAIPWLVPVTKLASSLRDDLVQAIGLHVFLIIVLLGTMGWLVLRRSLGSMVAHWQSWLAVGLGTVVLLGVLGLFRPGWQLGETSLSEVTAGGDLGHALTSTGLGGLIWLACGVGVVVVRWPHASRRTLARSPHAAVIVWGWRIPQRVWRGLQALLQTIFPTRTVPQPKPDVPIDTLMWARTASTTLPPDPETERPPPPAAESGPPSDFGWQTELSLPGEEERAKEEASPVPADAPPRKGEGGWMLPPLDLLASAAPQGDVRPDNAARARLIVDTLASFGVDTRISQINEGPTVTQFGVEPGWDVKTRQVTERDSNGRPLLDRDGRPKTRTEEVSRTRVRVSQITSLSNDLALALATPSIRIEAPVPGKPVLGIEVPNNLAALVTLRSVIESTPFQRLTARSKLALALGKNVAGEPIVADLAKMPHLLIAGATGSGKSVCLNSIIACLLMHAPPAQMRLVMIDPKRVELSAFARIPHLAFSSIVVDLDKVVGTLQAVIHEMESRYRRFASLAVRNIDAFNGHPQAPFRMPYWVVIIDELADLMMATPYEVERQVCRLAQLARATGIHLIIATQRPSVDVVTGLIKANFPTRIAFAVSSQVDSRTILDGGGAEKLLGRGDMLYMPTDAAKPKRIQGVFVSDPEIERLVSFWTQERFAKMERPMFDHLLEEAKAAVDELTGDEDPLLDRARDLAADHGRVSASLLQRRLRVGYPRAARLMDMLENDGVVGPAEGAGSREVLLGDEEDI